MHRELLEDRSGATAVEYGLIVALVALVCVGAFTLLGTEINAIFNTIVAAL